VAKPLTMFEISFTLN